MSEKFSIARKREERNKSDIPFAFDTKSILLWNGKYLFRDS